MMLRKEVVSKSIIHSSIYDNTASYDMMDHHQLAGTNYRMRNLWTSTRPRICRLLNHRPPPPRVQLRCNCLASGQKPTPIPSAP